MSNFITFGCWNKGNCNPGPHLSNPLSRVIAKMNGYIHALKKGPSFVCIAGDNYYPDIHTEKVEVDGKEKDKKIKTLSIPNLQSGFECLKQFHKRHRHIPIDIIAGNHDTEKTSDMVIHDDRPSSGQRDSCLITKTEIQATRGNRTMNFTMFNYRVMENTLVVMVDSNIYCEKLDDAAELNCYALLVDHTRSKLDGLRSPYSRSTPTIIDSVDQLKTFQEDWLRIMYASISGLKFANVVIVAHHPIALYKIKNKKCRYEIVPQDYMDFCYGIYTHLRDNNNSRHFFYSCADLHTYQSGTVTIKRASGPITISQEIAGTGGTELEPEYANADFVCPPQHESGLVDYHMTKIDHNHGFLHWSIHSGSGNLSATFIPIDSDLSGRASESGRASAREGGTKRRRQHASKRRRQRTSKRGRSKRQRRSRH